MSEPSRKLKQPRHGASLPLLAFAGAKKTTYDPRIAKQKASNLHAKRVNSYRKLKARLETEGKLAVPSSISRATMDTQRGEGGGEEEARRHLPPPPPPLPAPAAPSAQRHKNQGTKPFNTLQRIAAMNEQAREEQAWARATALEAAALRRERAEAAEARRKEKTALLRKRTSRGQPVMKYRIDGILSKLAAESAMSGGGGGGRR